MISSRWILQGFPICHPESTIVTAVSERQKPLSKCWATRTFVRAIKVFWPPKPLSTKKNWVASQSCTCLSWRILSSTRVSRKQWQSRVTIWPHSSSWELGLEGIKICSKKLIRLSISSTNKLISVLVESRLLSPNPTMRRFWRMKHLFSPRGSVTQLMAASRFPKLTRALPQRALLASTKERVACNKRSSCLRSLLIRRNLRRRRAYQSPRWANLQFQSPKNSWTLSTTNTSKS